MDFLSFVRGGQVKERNNMLRSQWSIPAYSNIKNPQNSLTAISQQPSNLSELSMFPPPKGKSNCIVSLNKTSDKYNIQHRKPLEMGQNYPNHLCSPLNSQIFLPSGPGSCQFAHLAFSSFLNSHCFQKTRLYRTGEHEGKGKWTKQQQTKYIHYLWVNIDEFRSKLSRKSRKVFVKMSKMIGSRSADQCRSHHQKILNEYESIENIITYYSRNIFKGKNMGLSISSKKEERQTMVEMSQLKESYFRWSCRDGNRLRLEIAEEAIFCVCYE